LTRFSLALLIFSIAFVTFDNQFTGDVE